MGVVEILIFEGLIVTKEPENPDPDPHRPEGRSSDPDPHLTIMSVRINNGYNSTNNGYHVYILYDMIVKGSVVSEEHKNPDPNPPCPRGQRSDPDPLETLIPVDSSKMYNGYKYSGFLKSLSKERLIGFNSKCDIARVVIDFF